MSDDDQAVVALVISAVLAYNAYSHTPGDWAALAAFGAFVACIGFYLWLRQLRSE